MQAARGPVLAPKPGQHCLDFRAEALSPPDARESPSSRVFRAPVRRGDGVEVHSETAHGERCIVARYRSHFAKHRALALDRARIDVVALARAFEYARRTMRDALELAAPVSETTHTSV